MEKTYTIFGRVYEESESILAERALTASFLETWADTGIDHGNDGAAWRESFNNWADSLCRDGQICDAAYNDLCPIGTQFK